MTDPAHCIIRHKSFEMIGNGQVFLIQVVLTVGILLIFSLKDQNVLGQPTTSKLSAVPQQNDTQNNHVAKTSNVSQNKLEQYNQRIKNTIKALPGSKYQ